MLLPLYQVQNEKPQVFSNGSVNASFESPQKRHLKSLQGGEF